VSEQLQVAIVGGGIDGLTAALALRQRGLKVAVFEQAVELGEIGAGISIHANAALLLQRIGLIDSIKKIGVPIAGLLLRTSAGEPIDFSARASSGIQTYNVHRAVGNCGPTRSLKAHFILVTACLGPSKLMAACN
jgi:salicylate hydroxylase